MVDGRDSDRENELGKERDRERERKVVPISPPPSEILHLISHQTGKKEARNTS